MKKERKVPLKERKKISNNFVFNYIFYKFVSDLRTLVNSFNNG